MLAGEATGSEVGWVAFILLAWAILFGSFAVSVYVRRRSPEFNFASATIVFDLRRLLASRLKSNSEILIVGGDGYSLTRSFYPWRRYLKRIFNLNCTVHYLLIAPRAEAIQALRSLSKTNDPLLKYYVVDNNSLTDEDRELVDAFETYHPTIFCGPDGSRMMWLERFHPPESTIAYSCTFYDEARAAAESMTAEHENQIRHLMQVSRASPAMLAA